MGSRASPIFVGQFVTAQNLGDLLGAGAVEMQVQLARCGRLKSGALRAGQLVHDRRPDDPLPCGAPVPHQQQAEICRSIAPPGLGTPLL
jgi:hypothetical protein